MSRIRPILQIVARASLSISDRIFITTHLPHAKRVRNGVSLQPTSGVLLGHAGYFDHGGRDAESAIPGALWAGVGDALGSAGFGGVGYAAGYFAGDGFVVEAEG